MLQGCAPSQLRGLCGKTSLNTKRVLGIDVGGPNAGASPTVALAPMVVQLDECQGLCFQAGRKPTQADETCTDPGKVENLQTFNLL